jgi:carbamoyl-phosphate synthase large subunit
MKSTGEIMGIDTNYDRALYKAMVASGVDVPIQGALIATIADHDKQEALEILRGFRDLGYTIHATAGTARFLNDNGIAAQPVLKIREGSPNLVDLIQDGRVNLMINTLSTDKRTELEAAQIRRASVEVGVNCLTSLDTARALLRALDARRRGEEFACEAVDGYLTPATV